MTFGERLTELRKERGFQTRTEFANFLGIPSTTLRNYETNVREPGHKILKQISELFDVSIDYLLCMSDNVEKFSNSLISNKEFEKIKKYRELDNFGKDVIDSVLSLEHKRCTANKNMLVNEHKSTYIKSIPLADFSLSAGTGNMLLDNTYEMIEIDGNKYPDADIAFKVRGNSMEPEYSDNDIVYIHKQRTLEPGQIGAFLFNGEQYLKKLIFKDGIYKLHSLNENYEDIEIDNDSLIIYGKVIN